MPALDMAVRETCAWTISDAISMSFNEAVIQGPYSSAPVLASGNFINLICEGSFTTIAGRPS